MLYIPIQLMYEITVLDFYGYIFVQCQGSNRVHTKLRTCHKLTTVKYLQQIPLILIYGTKVNIHVLIQFVNELPNQQYNNT